MIDGDDLKISCSVELPLGEAAEAFDLEKAVCSHGFFMMSPNRWDPLSRSLFRPLRFPPLDFDGDFDGSDCGEAPYPSAVVRISQHPELPCLSVRVCGVSSLSESQRRAIVAQVSRMLRLSPAEEIKAKEFVKMMTENGEEELLRSFGGRATPPLFEDMVKCILLCNCQCLFIIVKAFDTSEFALAHLIGFDVKFHGVCLCNVDSGSGGWSRTLSMAQSLCELQLELQSMASSGCPSSAGEKEGIFEQKKISACLRKRLDESNAEGECHGHVNTEDAMFKSQISNQCLDRRAVTELMSRDCCNEVLEDHCCTQLGNFPGPKELAFLEEDFLARRCNLGYRASRILKLSRGIIEGEIQLRELEKACVEPNLSTYDSLLEQLRRLDGFGPFTCANVLMCAGFYHVIPADSETIRHLKQVHAKASSIQTVTDVVQAVYGKYHPFQFLAYWAEVWHIYGQRFGKLSEMPRTDYRLITASNMKSEDPRRKKKIKSS
ncbi:PREDICTED: uncharacterized protein LOC104809040 [Tarenaya hassleriana]|uniref:uncharacterized protein LOC104809040 n=1 Tax=Tarenaya hassleriana TaxID=28532 RepID=UPI0008FD3AB3|nr:PREDICTED: uncharacterized protein LOC104809040 [Tarenaya hassleriana]